MFPLSYLLAFIGYAFILLIEKVIFSHPVDQANENDYEDIEDEEVEDGIESNKVKPIVGDISNRDSSIMPSVMTSSKEVKASERYVSYIPNDEREESNNISKNSDSKIQTYNTNLSNLNINASMRDKKDIALKKKQSTDERNPINNITSNASPQNYGSDNNDNTNLSYSRRFDVDKINNKASFNDFQMNEPKQSSNTRISKLESYLNKFEGGGEEKMEHKFKRLFSSTGKFAALVNDRCKF